MTIQTELEPALPPVSGDRIQLHQVILNLIHNAADAMSGVEDRPRQLRISTASGGDGRVRLMVQDVGVGLDSENLQKLFEPFFTTKSGGMGIGLSISRTIIERHGGRLWAEPNAGPGATFSFEIPITATVGSVVPARQHDVPDGSRDHR